MHIPLVRNGTRQTREEAEPKVLYEEAMDRLDDQQTDAVISDARTLVIEAVPGSGKTTTIAAKVAYLTHEMDIEPSRIVMMTYTKAAVSDIRCRMRELFEDIDTSQVHICTIHSLAYSIIGDHRARHHMPMPEVADGRDVRRVVRDLTKAETEDHHYLTDEELSTIETCVGYYKNMRHQPKGKEPMREFFDIYQRALRSLGPDVMDYDDMLLYAMVILEQDDVAKANARDRFDFWLIDEAQDCSPLQHQMIAALTANKNVTFVGDTDQSVYGFRAAKPELLEQIMDDAGTKTLRIESNYRADAHLCAVANRFIGHDETTKHIVATRGGEGIVTIDRCGTRDKQNRRILDFIDESCDECAILYRNNDIAFPLMQFLDSKHVDFSVRGPNLSFFTSRPVRDVVAFMRLADNPSDPQAFMQIYSKMSLFVKRSLAQRVADAARPGQDLFAELAKIAPKRHIATRARNVSDFVASLRRKTPDEMMRAITRSAYRTYLEDNGGAFRIGLLREMSKSLKTTKEFEDMLERVRTIAVEHTDTNSAITLSTIHSAKGLEWNRVAVIDVNEKILPAETAGQGELAISSDQEERNLMYVAITRAKHELLVTSSAKKPSRFVSEVALADFVTRNNWR